MALWVSALRQLRREIHTGPIDGDEAPSTAGGGGGGGEEGGISKPESCERPPPSPRQSPPPPRSPVAAGSSQCVGSRKGEFMEGWRGGGGEKGNPWKDGRRERAF